MTNGPEFDARVKDFAERSIRSLTPEKRQECELLAAAGEPGLRVFPSARYLDWCELIWGGQVIGLTSWRWLAEGDDSMPFDGPEGYDGPR
ncbi:MAG TPA: hypothetical protein VIJ07_22485 [Dermatophilaceae bacterium]